LLKVFSSFSKALILDRSNIRFALGVWLGLSFSIAVILSTVGIMDGFITSLKSGLKLSNGDITFSSRAGFFELGPLTKKGMKELGVASFSPLIESQAFVVANESSKGIVIRGVEGQSYSQVTGQDILPERESIIVGPELAKVLSIKVGDEVVLVMAQGNRQLDGLPLLKKFKVQGLIEHGIYQKDLRFVYMDQKELSEMLGTKGKVNMVSLNIGQDANQNLTDEQREQAVEEMVYDLEDLLGIDYRIKPYWEDYRSMLEAVEIEKLTISLILQIIVIISIFNVLSFVTFLNEKQSQQIFLFQALGLSTQSLRRTWLSMVCFLWAFSCAFSLVFVWLFNWMLSELSILSLPGDVYHMGRLQLSLDLSDYMIVFGTTLFWMILIIAFALYRLNKRSILYGLRKEFS